MFGRLLLLNKKLFLFIALVLISLGIYAFNDIQKHEFPELTYPFSIIEIDARGHNSEEINEKLIKELKNDLLNLDDLDYITTNIFDNKAYIIIRLNLGTTDLDNIHDEINKIILESDLSNYETNIVSTIHALDALYYVPVSLFEKNKEFIDDITNINGVKNVIVSETATESYNLELDIDYLADNNLSTLLIKDILLNQGSDYTLGYLNNESIQTDNSFTSENDLKNFTIGYNTETQKTILVEDIGSISLKSFDDFILQYNNEDIVYLGITFDDEVDVTKIAPDVKKVADDYSDVKNFVFNPDDVEKSISNIVMSLIFATLLVIVIILIGLGIRESLSIVITLPFTIFTTILILYSLGHDLQIISISGLIISIGIIIDNSIVIVDGINSNMNNNLSIKDSIIDSIQRNSYPILTSTLTTIIAFSPLLFLSGVGGEVSFTLPLTVIITLIISYISSIILVPSVSYYVMKPKKRKKNESINYLIKIAKIIRRPIVPVCVAISFLLLSTVLLVSTQSIEMFPSAQKDYIIIDFSNTVSTDVNYTKSIADDILVYVGSDALLAINTELPSFYPTLHSYFPSPTTGRIIYKYDGNIKDEINRIESILNDNLNSNVNFSVNQLELNSMEAPIIVYLQDSISNDTYVQMKEKIEKFDNVSKVDINLIKEVNKHYIAFNNEYLNEINVSKSLVEQELVSLLNNSTLDIINIDNKNNIIVSSDIQNINTLSERSINVNGVTVDLSKALKVHVVQSPEYLSTKDFEKVYIFNIYLSPNESITPVHEEIVTYLEKQA